MENAFPNCLVYGLVCPITHKIRYIGSTYFGDKEFRLAEHKANPASGQTGKWINFLYIIGELDNLKIIDLVKDIPYGQLLEEERRQIIEHHIMGYDLLNIHANPQRGMFKIVVGANKYKSIGKKYRIINSADDLVAYNKYMKDNYGDNFNISNDLTFEKLTPEQRKRPNKI